MLHDVTKLGFTELVVMHYVLQYTAFNISDILIDVGDGI